MTGENVERPAAPWLSILLPVFNVGPALDDCLASILNQAVDGIELVLLQTQTRELEMPFGELGRLTEDRHELLSSLVPRLGAAGREQRHGVGVKIDDPAHRAVVGDLSAIKSPLAGAHQLGQRTSRQLIRLLNGPCRHQGSACSAGKGLATQRRTCLRLPK